MPAIRYLLKLYHEAFSGLPRAAWLLSVVLLINRSGAMVLFFLSLYLTTQKGFNAAEAGLLISLFGFGGMAGAFLGGWLSDHIDPWKVQFISLLFGGLGYIILGYMDTAWGIGLVLFITSVISESMRPVSITAMAKICPPEIRARGFALNRLAVNLGMAIGPVVGGFIITLLSYAYIFWIDGMTCLIAAGALIYFFKGFHFEDRKKSETQSKVKSPFHDWYFLFILLILLMMGLAFSQVFSTWPLYLKGTYKLFEYHIGLLMALNASMIALVEMPLIHKVEKYSHLKTITVGAFLLFLGFAIMPLATGLYYAAFTVLLWTVGEMLVFPLTGSFVANRAPESVRGKYMGLFSFTFAFSFVIGPLAGTWVYQNMRPDYVWYLTGVLGVFAIVGLLFARQLGKNFNIKSI